MNINPMNKFFKKVAQFFVKPFRKSYDLENRSSTDEYEGWLGI